MADSSRPAAHELWPGDVLVGHDGQRTAVEAVRDTGRWEAVYNVEVEGTHTYFVGGDDWGFSLWAHNAAEYGVHWTSLGRWEEIMLSNRLMPGNPVHGKDLLWFQQADNLAQLKRVLFGFGEDTGAKGQAVGIIVDLKGVIKHPVASGGGGFPTRFPEGMLLGGPGGRGLNWLWVKNGEKDIKTVIQMIRDGRLPF